MILKFDAASHNVEQYLDSLEKYNINYESTVHKCNPEWWCPNGEYTTYKATIEIDSLDDVFDIINITNREVIIGRDEDTKELFLEIYDNYRE